MKQQSQRSCGSIAQRIFVAVMMLLANLGHAAAEKIHVEGAYTNRASHFAFPTNVDSFQRVSLYKYDQTEKDVSAGYNSTNLPVAITVYVYPAAKNVAVLPQKRDKGVSNALLANHFTQVTNDIYQARKETPVTLVAQDNRELVQGKATRTGRHAVFNYTEKTGFGFAPVQSELFLFLLEPDTMFLIDDRFYVKFRCTYPAPLKERAEAELKKFMNTFVWPTK